MGYIQHHAIIVTGWDEGRVRKAHAKAKELAAARGSDYKATPDNGVSPVFSGTANGQHSFLIGPDGSKEGWDESDSWDRVRKAWKSWAEAEPELYVDWVEVTFAGDDATITAVTAMRGGR